MKAFLSIKLSQADKRQFLGGNNKREKNIIHRFGDSFDSHFFSGCSADVTRAETTSSVQINRGKTDNALNKPSRSCQKC